MGEPRVLILGHSFIRRLNSFIIDSTHLDHRFMIHEAAQFKWHGVGGRTVERSPRGGVVCSPYYDTTVGN